MATSVFLREAQPSDSDPIEVLLLASYSEHLKGAYAPSLLMVALPAIAKANPILLTSGTFFVAQDGPGPLLGCGGWTHERPGTSERTRGVAHIRHFAVHPGRTRTGIGRRIYDRCCKQAHEGGVKTFECFSTLSAEPFYAALGFIKVGEDSVALTPSVRFPIVLMRANFGTSTTQSMSTASG